MRLIRLALFIDGFNGSRIHARSHKKYLKVRFELLRIQSEGLTVDRLDPNYKFRDPASDERETAREEGINAKVGRFGQ